MFLMRTLQLVCNDLGFRNCQLGFGSLVVLLLIKVRIQRLHASNQ